MRQEGPFSQAKNTCHLGQNIQKIHTVLQMFFGKKLSLGQDTVNTIQAFRRRALINPLALRNES